LILKPRGRAANLATTELKRDGKGSTPTQYHTGNPSCRDSNHEDQHRSTGQQTKSKIANPPANAVAPSSNIVHKLHVPTPGLLPSVPNTSLTVAENVLNIGGVILDPQNITREQRRQLIARQLLSQAIEANADAAERRTFPFKRFLHFAFKHQLTLDGWPIDICPTFPSDSAFQVEKIHSAQWSKIWDAVFTTETLMVRRWTAGLSSIVFSIWPFAN